MKADQKWPRLLVPGKLPRGMRADGWTKLPPSTNPVEWRTGVKIREVRIARFNLTKALRRNETKRRKLIREAATQLTDGPGFRRRMDRWLDLHGR